MLDRTSSRDAERRISHDNKKAAPFRLSEPFDSVHHPMMFLQPYGLPQPDVQNTEVRDRPEFRETTIRRNQEAATGASAPDHGSEVL